MQAVVRPASTPGSTTSGPGSPGLDGRLDSIEDRLQALDDRLDTVEEAFGKVDQRLETLVRVILPSPADDLSRSPPVALGSDNGTFG